MTGTTTGQTALPTATDADDAEHFLTVDLVTAEQTVANLFESATGHDHSGAGKGKPIGSAGIANGVTLTTPVFSGQPTGTGFGVWTAFTPGLIQNAGLTLSVATGRYNQLGKTVWGSINITINSAGLSGSPFNLTGLPVAGQVNGSPAWGWYTRTGGTVYPITAIWNTTTSIEFFGGNGTGVLGTNPAFAAAAGDTIAVNFMYEAA